MNKIYMLLLLGLFSGFLTAQIPNYVPSNGLVGWWPFNGNANDESGNGNNGTVNGATLTTDRFGVANKAYSFDGVNDFIEVVHSPSLSLSTGVSFTFWMFSYDYSLGTTGPNTERVPIGKQRQSLSSGLCFETVDAIGTCCGAQFDIRDASGAVQYEHAISIPTNSWVHISGTYDGTILKLYQNGLLLGTGNGPMNLSTIIQSLFFGKEGALGRYFKGNLDDIGMWNRALTQQEITNLYNTALPLTCSISASSNQICNSSSSILTMSGPTSDTVLMDSYSATFGSAWSHTFNTQIGGLYMLKISGKYTTGTYCPQLVKDAAFQLPGFYGSSNAQPIDFGCIQDGAYITQNCPSNFIRPTPDVYNTSNSYNYFFTAISASFIAGFSDVVYGDNCGNLTYQLYKIIPRAYSWSNGATTPSITVSPAQTTTYTCTVTANGQSCSSSQTISVIPAPLITAANNTLCAGASTTLTASSSASNVSACASSALPSNLQAGLVGYWPFCGNANDASGNGNNGTVNGATLTTDRFGNANSAYSFDGVDDRISLGNILNGLGEANQASTISIWVKSTDGFIPGPTNSEGTLISDYHRDGSCCETTYMVGLVLKQNPSRLVWRSEYPGSVNETVHNSSSYTSNVWNNIIITRNGIGNQSVHLNGQLVVSALYNASINYTIQNIPFEPDWQVGAQRWNDGSFISDYIHFFKGQLDDIAIYNRALTVSEIQQLYNQGQTTYSWSNGATTPSITVSPAQTTTYTCTVTTNGTSCSSDVTVTVNPLPTVNAGIDQTVCVGTAVTLSGSGANTYSWNNVVNNGVAFTPASTATYIVTGTNTATGCTNTDEVLVTVNPLPIANAGADFTKTCVQNPSGLGIGAASEAGVSYSWSPSVGLSSSTVSNPVANPSVNSTYTVTATNTASGCTASDQVLVTVNTTVPVANAGADFTKTCVQNPSGLGIGAASEAGVSYSWSPSVGLSSSTVSNPMANPLVTSTYTVIATNTASGCTASDQVLVTVNTTVPVANAGADFTKTCVQNPSGLGIGASSVAGVSYSWSPATGLSSSTVSNPLANPSMTSTYTVTATNTASGCTASDQVLVTVNNALPTVNAGNDQTVCAGTSVTLSGSGANTYAWSNNISNGVAFTPVSTATYTVTGTNTTTGCTNTDQVVVNVNPIPNVFQPNDQVVCCQTVLSPIVFASSFPGTSFSWQAQQNPNVTGYPLSGTGIIPSMTLTNSALNTQSVIFTVTPSLNGCSGIPVSFSINVLPCSVFVVQPSSQTACAGSNLNPVLFSGNYTSVNWINTNVQTGLPISGTGDIAQAILTNGTSNTITSSFTVVPTYTDPLFLGASCQGPSQSFTISVLPLPNVSAGPDQELCQGQSTTLFGSGANTYSWSNNVTNGVGFLPTVTQDYVVSGTNVATGCVNVDTVTVIVHPLPAVSAGLDQTVCKGDSISLSGSGAQSYQWNNNVIDGVSFAPQSTQTYTVTGTDANGCSATDGVTVSVNEPSFSTLTESALDSYTLNGQTYTQSGTYTQVITNASGCDSTITLNLTLSFTGLEGLNHYEWNIYPNPTHDYLTIECMHEGNERLRLMDAIGRVVLAGNLAGKKTELVLTELSTGVYTLCIGNVSFRVVKQ
jgi:hypothetical protein